MSGNWNPGLIQKESENDNLVEIKREGQRENKNREINTYKEKCIERK